MSELRSLIRACAIKRVVIYCLDRLSRDPTHGVILTQELEKHDVILEAVTEDMDNSELGKLINYIRGFSAKLEAEKIKERTGRGIRARVFDRKLPVTYTEPFGYSWDKKNTRLIPNKDYDIAKLIIDFAFGGKSFDYIISELKRRAIASPRGLPEWNKHTISGIIRNPVYAGQFYAFKSRTKEPKMRKGTRYGKTSKERLPPDQWHYIPEIEVTQPIITMNQRDILLEQLEKRQKYSQRNAKRNYLLRGFVFCETHHGKKGEARVYCGQPHNGSWRYFCPVGKCQGAFIDGLELENMVAVQTAFFLFELDKRNWALTEAQMGKTSESLKFDITKLQKENDSLIGKMTKLEDSMLDGQVDELVYKRLKTQYDTRRRFLAEEQTRLLDEIKQIDRAQNVSEYMKDLIHKWKKGLAQSLRTFTDFDGTERPEAETAYWRQLLTSINFELHIHPLSATDSYLERYKIKRKEINCELRYALPLEIALPLPG